jgi:glycosyltransferase involved in cell wall biosynthesis
MRILAVVPTIYGTSPGQRYRIEQWEPYLRSRGASITYAPFACEELHSLLYTSGNLKRKLQLVAQALRRRSALMKTVRDYDVVYIFREAALLGPPIFERRIHRLRVPIVFDFDDAIFVSYRSPSNGYLSYLKFAGKTKEICRLATNVTVGNPYLAQYARQVNSRVTIIPSTIDTDEYTVERTREPAAIPVIGWTGSYSTLQHLDTLRGALQRLAKTDRFKLRVIGPSEYKLEGVDCETIRWRAETEVADLRPIDIGIMPLPDDAWSKGKCGMKALQFMAAGIPTVVSPVGFNTELIKNDENGLLAATEADWVEVLGRLLRSPELRLKLGDEGRATVESNYSAAIHAPRFYQVLESAVLQAPEVVNNSVGETAAGLR